MFCRAALVVVVNLFLAHAQPAGTSSSFEVVSIKPSAPPNGGRFSVGVRGGPGTSDPGRMTFSYVTVARLIGQAYEIYPFQLSCPDWLNTERFDIIAKVPEGATKAQIPAMLRNLLADRFKLKVRQETREMPILELSVAKGGPKLKAATEVPEHPEGMSGEPALDGDGFPKIPPGQTNKLVVEGRARWQAPDAQMEQLTRMLAGELGKPVTDSTGLKGRYNFTLYWMQDEMRATQLTAAPETEATPSSSTTVDAFGPTIFRALRDQLGLRLDPKKGPANILVVDSAVRQPTEN
ncbi:MAG: TIGR03435 family protein [Bryobacteraceae bacterium]